MAHNVSKYYDGQHRDAHLPSCPPASSFRSDGICNGLSAAGGPSGGRCHVQGQLRHSRMAADINQEDGNNNFDEEEEEEEEEEEDDDDDYADSALGGDDFDDGDTTSTVSLSESIMQYRVLNGRTYHNERHGNLYWGPNDERSQDAEDISHQVYLYLLDNKLFLAPLRRNEIRRVLDIGTGTGMWANDFADDFPSAEVIGTDISPIQPAWTAPNCRFEMEDAEQEWTYPHNSFDYIHMRTLGGTIQDWTKLFQQSYDTLRPGGWIESHEAEGVFQCENCELPVDSPLRAWSRYFSEAGKLLQRTFAPISDNVQVEGIEAAGFKNIKVIPIRSPIGNWSSEPRLKKSGLYAKLALEQDLEGYISLVWTHVLQKPIEEMHVFLAAFRKALRQPNMHIYINQRVVYAQKPLDAT